MKMPKKKILVQKKEKIDIKKYLSRPQPQHIHNKVLTNFNTLEFQPDLISPIHHTIHNSSNIITNPKFTYLLTSTNDSINLTTEPNENNYLNKYYESFPGFSRNKNNNYSEKIKTYRKNLDEIVNKLNESNIKYRKIINKENIRLNTNNDFNEYYAQTPKYLTNNTRSKIIEHFDTMTYNQKNKNNVIKNFGERTDIRNKSNLLRNTNYLEVSQQIDTLTKPNIDNNDISYDEIIKSNSKLNDILNYNYKINNDIENEKVFILMKLRLKNAEIMINKLESENKKYLAKNNKYNNLTKLNNKLETENKNLKIENEKLNINIDLIKKEINSNNEKIRVNNRNNEIKELKEKYKTIYKENKNLKLILQDIQSKYKILQEIHLELKQKINEENNKEILSLKNEVDILNKKCANYEKRITELNGIENKYKEITKKKEENKIKKAKELFCDFYKKYTNDKLKENKLKMIIGMYLQKENIKFNQKIKEYKDKNKKLVKSVRKLNDQIIEFKLKNLNSSNKK